MEEKKYNPSDFSLVQDDERLVDKPLKTKQLTYFQDSMLRFGKNKFNLAATIILFIMIVMAIFVPVLSNKNFKNVRPELAYLPPRVPLLEKLGVLDGTSKISKIIVDTNDPLSYDEASGNYFPRKYYNLEYIIPNTLTNKTEIGTEKSPLFVGGYNTISITGSRTGFGIISKAIISTSASKHTKISIDIEELAGDGILEVYYYAGDSITFVRWEENPELKDDFYLLGTINSNGIHEIDPYSAESEFDLPNGGVNLYLRYRMESGTAKNGTYVKLNSVSIIDDQNNLLISGYELSDFLSISANATEYGSYDRSNAVVTYSYFRYNVYKAIFDDEETTIGGVEFNRILDENEGMRASIVVADDNVNPSDPKHFYFSTDDTNWPIKEVVSWSEFRGYRTYIVVLDGPFRLGFEDVPYYIFGTDVAGKDLFTLIWLGLRTSLLLGVIASVINIFIGVIWGSVSAYYGGQVDMLMERFTEIWISFPQITMIAIISSLLNPGFLALLIFMIYDGWVGVSGVTRMQFYRYKGREYILAARTLGAKDSRIIFKHILPNALGTIITRVILSIPSVIFLEANLSFLGFGIGNGSVLEIGPLKLTGTSIGVLLADGQEAILSGKIWLIVFPAIIVSILMITFNMFGNALRDALNPQLRGNE